MTATVPTYLSPVWNGTQFFDNNGNLLAGGQIYQYEAGSFTVEQVTYTGDTNQTTPNTNPIILDANGRIDTEIWLQEGLYYNLVLEDVNGNILVSLDNIIGSESSSIPQNPSAATAVTVWNQSSTPSYISGTQFLISGNVVTDYAIGNRVQFVNGTNTYGYGTVSAVSYSAPYTYITIIPDSLSIGSNLTKVYWSSLVVYANGATIDAGAVSWTSALTYSNAATVGGQITLLETSVSGILTPRATPGSYIQANITVNDLGFITAVATGNTLTTKGDLEVYTTGLARLGIGVDGTVLTANSSAASGMAWEAPFNALLSNGATTNLVRNGASGFVADPDLTVTLAADTVYNITCYWHGASPSAGVYFSMAYTGTAQANASWAYHQVNTGGNGDGGPFALGASSLLGGFGDMMMTAVATIYTTSSGNFSFNWGNASAGGNSITRYAGSGINAVEVA